MEITFISDFIFYIKLIALCIIIMEGFKEEYQNRQILKNPSVGKEQCRNRFRSSVPVRNRYNQPTAIGCSNLQLFITSLHGLLWLQSTITGSFLHALRSFCSWNILIWWCTQLSHLKIFFKFVAKIKIYDNVVLIIIFFEIIYLNYLDFIITLFVKTGNIRDLSRVLRIPKNNVKS